MCPLIHHHPLGASMLSHYVSQVLLAHCRSKLVLETAIQGHLCVTGCVGWCHLHGNHAQEVCVDLQIRKQYADAFEELEDEEEDLFLSGELSDHEKQWDNEEDEESTDGVPFSGPPSIRSQGSVASEGKGSTAVLFWLGAD